MSVNKKPEKPREFYRAEAKRLQAEYGLSRLVAQHRVLQIYGMAAREAFKIGRLPG